MNKALTRWSWICNKDTTNIASSWRSLKRLAIQGHDHERELIFFAEEIKSQRGKQDKLFSNLYNLLNDKTLWPGGSRYWFGVLYELFSDFGRSVLRPLLGWIFFVTFFAAFYLSQHLTAQEQTLIGWVFDTVETTPCMQLHCLNQHQGRPELAAFYLSVR